MSENRGVTSWVSCFFIYLVSVGLGIATAILWATGYLTSVRKTLPYVLFITGVLLLVMGISIGYEYFKKNARVLSLCFNRYAVSALIGIAIVIVMTLLVLVSTTPFWVSVILAFIGSFGFWLMIIAFFAYVICKIKGIGSRRIQ